MSRVMLLIPLILIISVASVTAQEIDEKFLPYVFTESDFIGYDYALSNQGERFIEIAEGVGLPGVQQIWKSPEGGISLWLFIFDSFQEAAKGTKYFADTGSGVNRWGSNTGSIAGDEYWSIDKHRSVTAVINNIGFVYSCTSAVVDVTYSDLFTKLVKKIETTIDPVVLASMEQAKESQITKEKYNQMVSTLTDSALMTGFELFAERDSKWVIDMNGFAMGRRMEWKKENGELIGIDICEFESEEAAQSAVDFKTMPTQNGRIFIPYYHMDDSLTFSQELNGWKEPIGFWDRIRTVPCVWRKGNITVQMYYYSPEEIDIDTVQSIGYNLADRISYLTTSVAETEDTTAEAPQVFELFQNVPNPFNPATAIRYMLYEPGMVDLRIYDQLGREIAILTNEYQTAGSHENIWNGRDAGGNRVSSGMYFYSMRAEEKIETRRMALVK